MGLRSVDSSHQIVSSDLCHVIFKIWNAGTGRNSKSDATRCQILRLKCTKFDFRWRFAPDPAGGAYSTPPDPLAVFNGPTFKGRAGEVGQKGKGREKEEEGK